ncbi:MAG: DUF1501 domain-containing protein [Gemmataceae bacterium]|nr:DUF1501 domain-containing protein [Gemmataceae bacterium]
MLTRRQFLTRSLQGASLLSVGTVVPEFLVNTALAAEAGKDNILVVLEMAGGNDGLNTVIPHADDVYHKMRPTLRYTKDQVVKVDDSIGLHPSLRGLGGLLEKGQLAIVQGVGYPNPDRSHFESMDIWQSGEVGRKLSGTGWLARGVDNLKDGKGGIPAMQVGPEKLPLALQGASGGVLSFNNKHQYRLNLAGTEEGRVPARKKLLDDLARLEPGDKGGLQQFVQRRQLQTYSHLEKLEEILREGANNNEFEFIDGQFQRGFGLNSRLQLVARLITKGFGTRIFYVALDGFDTHSGQMEEHKKLLGLLDTAVTNFFNLLAPGGHDKRTVLMTFSEFGRRVGENGSKGTDHGSGSSLFVAGPAVKAGLVGKHPSLNDLDAGDLKFHTDFRRVYATLLDQWLGCDSKAVLGGEFEAMELLNGKA